MFRTASWTGLSVALALTSPVALAEQEDQRDTMVFEAEAVTTPSGAWLKNRFTEDKWNLWSTDKDADKKWSGGVVLQSPRVLKDRARPEDGAPVLHTRITGIPKGRWAVTIRNIGRTLAVSLDGGKTWRPISGRSGALGVFDVTDGTLAFQIDDRFADKNNRGSGYYDFVLLEPMPPQKDKAKVTGWATKRVWEEIDRGLVAMPIEKGKVYLSWRLLAEDPDGVAFNVYRQAGRAEAIKLNAEPVRRTTDFVDEAAPANEELAYTVRPVIAGTEDEPSKPVLTRTHAKGPGYLSIKLDGDHTFQKVGVADLNGDGRYDYVIKQPNTNIDPYHKYWRRSKDTYKIEAYLADGSLLWRNDLGWSIERGIWYSPYVVWDLDGDGKAEVAVKTGEGDPRDPDGRVTKGPEFVSIWDGRTGKLLDKRPWPSRKGFIGNRERAYNMASRNQLGIAYLDGKTPCLIVARGTYNTMKVVAYQFHKGRLDEVWRWRAIEEPPKPRYFSQGAHFMHGVDVDGDRRDEVVLGSSVLDDNGRGLWSTGLGHPDHCYVGDIDPSRPGLEIYYGIEFAQPSNGMCLVDAKTGRILWGLSERTWHVHASGLCADIDPNHPGMECYGGERDKHGDRHARWMFSAKGKLLTTEKEWNPGLSPRAVYWDADPYREVLVRHRIFKYGGKDLTKAIQGSHAAWADVVGDWREEVIASVKGELRIYTTTIPATDRRVCLMQDPIHRIDVAHLAMGYPQPPMTSFCPSATPAR